MSKCLVLDSTNTAKCQNDVLIDNIMKIFKFMYLPDAETCAALKIHIFISTCITWESNPQPWHH